MSRTYKLLVDDEWVNAELTESQVHDIRNELEGSCVINRQYDIKLSNGENIDLGIIDGIKNLQ